MYINIPWYKLVYNTQYKEAKIWLYIMKKWMLKKWYSKNSFFKFNWSVFDLIK